MNRLQKLITDKLSAGKSYRRLAEESGLSHVSIAQYHKDAVEPSGKSLAMLAKYFGADYWELLESFKGEIPRGAVSSEGERRQAVELRLVVAELEPLSPTEQLEWLVRIRKWKEAGRQE